ncbi:MAG TPA: hypothetical protein VFS31_01105, partial [Chitinophagaceae bacterium]|nr:hypothetical protein [Chitinophagaceae bacterium]
IDSLLIIQLGLIIFHLLILLNIVPAAWVWGGRIQSADSMYLFETASLLFSLFFLLILWYKRKAILKQQKSRSFDIIMWVFFSFFLLNTLGNLLAKSLVEKSFALLTLLMAALIWIVLKTRTENIDYR